MNRIDRLIEEALSEEDRAIVEQTAERGYFRLGLDQFSGKLGWVTWVVMIVQSAMFVVGVWAAWQFFGAGDVLTALKWGIPAATLIVVATTLKLSLMPQMQADRVLRELRRLELMIARRDADG
ncbi:DUF6768 family protein [Maritimibacter dapengensis]|uniref:Holin-X, holin superfamily III n=1 Tax=Maritimibacter dapengensis TaxID=2836868 RepID=A0ABS6SYL1_9RHOB|nr:DUF6768 family protein [Maritimibacter dapengensis]MBV7378042.1 hypothetical protein [Maritimibacter dapengensis]